MPPAVSAGRFHSDELLRPSAPVPPFQGSAGSFSAQGWRRHPTEEKSKKTSLSSVFSFLIDKVCLWMMLDSTVGVVISLFMRSIHLGITTMAPLLLFKNTFFKKFVVEVSLGKQFFF